MVFSSPRRGGWILIYLLLDNGSLRPTATLALRGIAGALSARVSITVHPVSLLHSHKIAPAELEGKPADIFIRFIRRHCNEGKRHFSVIPMFFGPSRALTEYLPEVIEKLQREFDGLNIRVEKPIVSLDRKKDATVVRILKDQVEQCREKHRLDDFRVVLLDHGSPAKEVTLVRDFLGEALEGVLSETHSRIKVDVASMERREGDEYAFNEPLLESILRGPGFDTRVIVCMLFLNPGRHAGPGGDVATICASAEHEVPGLKTYMTPLVGEHPGLIDILEQRVN